MVRNLELMCVAYEECLVFRPNVSGLTRPTCENVVQWGGCRPAGPPFGCIDVTPPLEAVG